MLISHVVLRHSPRTINFPVVIDFYLDIDFAQRSTEPTLMNAQLEDDARRIEHFYHFASFVVKLPRIDFSVGQANLNQS